ncbi:MAG: hypothetical protein AAGE59_16245 [Cyanobacteria bacterium P01_F01_bin.86]
MPISAAPTSTGPTQPRHYSSFRHLIQRRDTHRSLYADWHISSSTNLAGVKCDYIFRSYERGKFADRLPVDPDAIFTSGEFEKWIAVRKDALNTIDITFTQGIDWQAFFQSLQTVKQQHPEANVAMKAVEEEGGIFIARLKLETELTGDERESLKASVETEIKESFPDEDKKTAQVHLEDLANDLKQPEPNPAKLKTRFMGLLGVAIALGTHVATATDFANNVLELSPKLSVPTQALEPRLEQLKQTHPESTRTQDE